MSSVKKTRNNPKSISSIFKSLNLNLVNLKRCLLYLQENGSKLLSINP